MDNVELIWGWLNGLVRRIALAVLAFFVTSAVSAMLVLGGEARESDLRNLDAYSQLHAKYAQAFVEMANLAAALGGPKSSQLSAVEPLRRSIEKARDEQVPSLECSSDWAEAMLQVQSVPGRLAGSCVAKGEACEIPHDRILLDALVSFEHGIDAVQDAIPTLMRLCFVTKPPASVCDYFVKHRENEIDALRNPVEKHFRPTLSPAERRLLALPSSSGKCRADAGYLAKYRALVAAIDPAARPRTLADFEKLGDGISLRRVAIQSEDTRVGSPPASGLPTVSIPHDAALPLLAGMGLVAILYGFLNIRRLDRLSRSTSLGEERSMYQLYVIASHAFTSPVFGAEELTVDPAGRCARLASRLASFAFSWIPYFSLATSAVALGWATKLALEARSFSLASLVGTLLLVALQALAVWGFMTERRDLKSRFDAWTRAHPLSTTDSPGETP